MTTDADENGRGRGRPRHAAGQGHMRVPAEWEPHAATWMAWPHYRGDWPGKFEPVPWVYAEIIRHVGHHDEIELIVKHMGARNQPRKVLAQANALNDNVPCHLLPTDPV